MLLNFDERWRRLVREVTSGAVVPFAGAGVSFGAVDPTTASFRPTLAWLRGRLNRKLRRHTGDASALRDLGSRNRDFSRYCEIASWIVDQEDLVASLGLVSFTRMTTQPSHRYIARLAREGWIDEVVTTNWDTCFERAYRATFAHARVHNGDFPPVVVTETDHRSSHRHGSPDGSARSPEPSFRVMKLNGCAAPWDATPPKPPDYSSILLTERQLSALREECKRDHLRDLLRTKVLVFTGFGSDEAQVRHTVLDIVSQSPDTEPSPYVIGHDVAASFAQAQLLRASDPTAKGDSDRFIHGGHDESLALGPSNLKLDAGLVWERIYQAAMWYRVVSALRLRGSQARRWLDQASGCHRSGGRVVCDLVQWLGDPDSASTRGLPALVGRRWWLWSDPMCWGSDHTLPLLMLLRAARGQSAAAPQHVAKLAAPQYEWYRRFGEEEVALVALLLLLSRDDSHTGFDEERARMGLLPRRKGGSERYDIVFDTATRGPALTLQTDESTAPRLAGAWTLPGRDAPPSILVRWTGKRGDNKTMRVFHFRPKNIADLAHGAARKRRREHG